MWHSMWGQVVSTFVDGGTKNPTLWDPNGSKHNGVLYMNRACYHKSTDTSLVINLSSSMTSETPPPPPAHWCRVNGTSYVHFIRRYPHFLLSSFSRAIIQSKKDIRQLSNGHVWHHKIHWIRFTVTWGRVSVLICSSSSGSFSYLQNHMSLKSHYGPRRTALSNNMHPRLKYPHSYSIIDYAASILHLWICSSYSVEERVHRITTGKNLATKFRAREFPSTVLESSTLFSNPGAPYWFFHYIIPCDGNGHISRSSIKCCKVTRRKCSRWGNWETLS